MLEGVLKVADGLESIFEGYALMPRSHVEIEPVRARSVMTVRDGHVLEVSAFVVRHEPPAWRVVVL
jgi:hypothetical protein